MTKTLSFILFFLFIILIPAAESTPPRSPDEKEIPSIDEPYENHPQTKREKYIGIRNILDKGIIEINPGMTILDIGTGVGLNAYEFADKLKGTGKVFATDILNDRIDFVKKEAEKRGLRNLYPILVQRDGADEFYSQHKYDLIILSNVYHNLDKRVEYFKKMSKNLKKGGELIVIMCKSASLYQLGDIIDFKGLVKELSQELHENEPFYKRLRQSTQELIKQQSNNEPNEVLKNAIIDDFNQILLYPHFYNDFQRLIVYKTVSFSKVELNLYDWLLMCLKEEKVFDKAQKDLNPKEIRAIIKLNKLLFFQRFRQYCLLNPNLFVSDIHLQTSKFVVIDELKEAGYKLKKEYNALPYSDILFFRVNKHNKK